MENNKDSDCKCSFHGICHGIHSHHWMHLVIKIFIALFIFWCGVQFGELRTTIHGGYGNHRMMGSYEQSRNMMYYGGGPVMMTGQSTVPQKSASTATTTKK
ncbi:MAG: hypothetical protein NTU85_02585 [Candidatus Kaiserbacteria bacterium]|nr:hypothetical protein [Candidatus Kaiserbacteria bacterium]